MKALKHIVLLMSALVLIWACEKDKDNIYSFDYIPAPSKVSAVFDITQDNTGLVSIFPNAEGAQVFSVDFGDDPNAEPMVYNQGETATHMYTEGQYEVSIVATGITNLSSTYKQQINVSFEPPQNLVIDVQNDISVSNQVNMSALADFATVFEFYFGEVDDEEPILALPEEVVSHVYEKAGMYTLRVIAKGGAIATLDSTFTFEAVEVSGPVTAAPTPPSRAASSVISIFSDAYSNVADTDFNPNWGQSTIVTTAQIDGSETLKYANLNYQGTQFGSTVDATFMDYLHIDMWTEDAASVEVFPISEATGEKSYSLPIEAGKWVSYDIPMSYFTDLELGINDLIQFKFVGTDGSSIYLDNLYFYKGGVSSNPVLPLDFESPDIDYSFTNFDGGESTVIDNPQSNGINTSTKVVRMIKSPGQPWGGSYIGLASAIDFSESKTFTMKVYAPRAGAKVLLKIENKDDNTKNYEKEVATTKANEWEELTFDYSGVNVENEYHNVVIIFELGTQGDGSADFTFLYDDIALMK